MKQIIKNKKIISAIIIILIIIAGIIVATKGFNVEVKFRDNQKIELNIGKNFEISEIKQITNEVLKNSNVMIQKVEIYEDVASITANEITEEQKNEIVNKVNEKYGTSISAENTSIVTIPRLHLKDLLIKNIVPFSIVTAIVVVYMSIRYFKLGLIKTFFTTICAIIIAQLVLFSLIAITRAPIGNLTVPSVIIVLVCTIIALITKNENELEIIKEKENKNNK